MQLKQGGLLTQYKNNELLQWILRNVKSKCYKEEYDFAVEKK